MHRTAPGRRVSVSVRRHGAQDAAQASNTFVDKAPSRNVGQSWQISLSIFGFVLFCFCFCFLASRLTTVGGKNGAHIWKSIFLFPSVADLSASVKSGSVCSAVPCHGIPPPPLPFAKNHVSLWPPWGVVLQKHPQNTQTNPPTCLPHKTHTTSE